jgi:hypothetical protein
MSRLRRLRLFLVSAVLLISAGALLANVQIRDAGSKIRGDAYSRSSTRTMRHSRDVSRDFRNYAQRSRRNSQPVSPTIARTHVDELAQNVKLTQKYLAEEKKEFAGDKKASASLDKVEKQVQVEAKQQAALAELVKGDNIDADAVVKACEDAEEAIDKAVAEHDEMVEAAAGAS